MPKATEITPNLSLLSEVLYESEFISQMWMLYNSHKQFVSCGDAYAQKWSVKVSEHSSDIGTQTNVNSPELQNCCFLYNHKQIRSKVLV